MLVQAHPLPSTEQTYRPGPGFDEAFAQEGQLRALYGPLAQALSELDLAQLAADVNGHAQRAGVKFGGDDAAQFVVDPVPRLIDAADWRLIDAGLAQRSRALDAFVCDVYGERIAISCGVVPERVLAGVPFLEPDLTDCAPPPGARVAIAGLDLVRGAGGEFLVLEDNVRTPSGMGYVLAAREAVAAHLRALIAPAEVLAPLRELLQGVLAAARAPDDDGTGLTVLLSDGPSNSAWYEHRVLARLVGVPVIGLEDLRVQGEQLRLRANGRRVVAIYRRTDEDRLRGEDGELTPVGALLLPALRAGAVGLVNGFGTGVADDKRIYPYVERLVRLYLKEEPLLRSVPTHDLADQQTRTTVLGRLDQVVLKPRHGHGGAGVLIGPRATAAQLRHAAAAIRAAPEDWVAQEPVSLSTHPTVVNGTLAPRHVDLRPFVFFDGRAAHALPGGLTRVALAEGELVVNSSRGGGAKDTWVLQ